MKYTYLLLIAICLFAFSSCTSTKEEKKTQAPEFSIQSPVGQETKVTGKLEQSANGSYVIHTGAGKSVASWLLVSSEAAPEVYSQLSNYVGKTVKVTGVIVEQKSAWNKTIGVTAVE